MNIKPFRNSIVALALSAIMLIMLTFDSGLARIQRYGDSTTANQGIVVTLGPNDGLACIGYEYVGDPGLFTNCN